MNFNDEPSRALPVEVGAQPLAALIARAEAAAGPDRELDGLLHVAMSGGRLTESDAYGWVKGPGDIGEAPRLTASLDAALALVERVLPGWTVANINQDDTKRWWSELREGYRTAFSRVAISGPLPTPELALVLALLRALQAQPHRHNARDGSSPQNNEPST